MRVFSATDIGRKRQINQDYIFASDKPVGNLPNLFVVADGMGGHNAGDFASRFGVSVLVETIQNDRSFNPVKIIRKAIEAANGEILHQAQKEASLSGMGTTVVAATVVGNYVYIANVGDSRFYLDGADGMIQISKDHSLIAEMIRLGEISEEEGRNHPDKNIITRAVGINSEVKIDFFDVKMEPDNRIVMCSDGLTNMVTDERIHEILCEAGDDKAQRLIEEANQNGGKDNIAVIVVEPFVNEVEEC